METWLVALHVLEDGRPYSFAGHEALLDVIADRHLRKVIMKAAQIGATTAFIGFTFWIADAGKSVIYYLPDETLIPDIHKLRIKPLMDYVPYIRTRVADKDAVGTIPVGKGVAQFLGLQGKLAVESRPAHVLVFDEVDKADPRRVTIAKERLGHTPPSEQSIYYLSKPSVPGYGISALYDASDQREYLAKCRCGEWTPLVWLGGVVEKVGDNVFELRGKTPALRCVKCGKEITDGPREWVASYPGRDYHGYKLSRLHFRVHTPADLWREFQACIGNESALQNFYNASLGEPYIQAGAGLTLADLDAIKENYLPLSKSAEPCVIGIDPNPGAGNHYVIGTLAGRRVIAVGATDWTGLNALFSSYKIIAGVIDGRGDTGKALDFQKAHGQIYLADYATEAPVYMAHATREGMGGYANWLKLDRTMAMDEMVGAVRGRRIAFPKNAEQLGERGKTYNTFYEHLLAIARIQEQGKDRVRFVWRESGPDHYAHALTYLIAAYAVAASSYVPPIMPEAGGERTFRA